MSSRKSNINNGNKSPTRQTKLTFRRSSKGNHIDYEQLQLLTTERSWTATAPQAAPTTVAAPMGGKMQLKLSTSKIRLQTAQMELSNTDALRRKSAPQLISFSIAPQLASLPTGHQTVPRLPAYAPQATSSRTLGLPTDQQQQQQQQSAILFSASGTDSNSDPSSSSVTGGSSTSPESLLDNILSGASSVSVQSSSAASDITVAPPPTPALPPPTAAATARSPVPPKPKRVLDLKASPELRISPPTPDSGIQLEVSSLLLPTGAAAAPMDFYDNASLASPRSCSPSPVGTPQVSPSNSFSMRPATSFVNITFPEDLKCAICMDVYTDPRTLHCLHSFCLQCLVNENTRDEVMWEDRSNYSLRSSTPDIATGGSAAELATVAPARQRGASFSLRSKKSLDRMMLRVCWCSG